MTILEIVLLVLGVACFVLGFVLPEKSKNALQWEEKKQTRRIDELIESEIDKYKETFAESLNEEIDAYFEKAERGLERVSNEKIMAVNEYGDTVLADINKSHDEAVFLYSMLNEKHDDILKSQSEIESKSKDIRNTLKEIEAVRDRVNEDYENSKQNLIKELEEKENEIELEKNKLSAMEEDFNKGKDEWNVKKDSSKKTVKKNIKRNPESVDVSMYGNNHNEEILRLYKEGKSNVSIAKELGLGVGEVKLVIDLAKM